MELQPLPSAAEFAVSRRVDSPAATIGLGWRAGRDLLAGGEVVLLWGPLGAGKTLLVQAICRGLDITEDVTSPSFTLARRYAGRLVVHHLDFYRVPPNADLADIGVDAILTEVEQEGAVLLVEWPLPVLSLVPRRLELLALPGAGTDERTWHLRGVPALPPAWRSWLLETTEDT